MIWVLILSSFSFNSETILSLTAFLIGLVVDGNDGTSSISRRLICDKGLIFLPRRRSCCGQGSFGDLESAESFRVSTGFTGGIFLNSLLILIIDLVDSLYLHFTSQY